MLSNTALLVLPILKEVAQRWWRRGVWRGVCGGRLIGDDDGAGDDEAKLRLISFGASNIIFKLHAMGANPGVDYYGVSQ